MIKLLKYAHFNIYIYIIPYALQHDKSLIKNRYVLSNQVDFYHRDPRPDDIMKVGYFSVYDNFTWHEVGSTKAWNFQTGCMLQWFGSNQNRLIIFNDVHLTDHSGHETMDGHKVKQFVSKVVDITTRDVVRIFDRPVFSLNADASKFLSINFARLADSRPGYGYEGVYDIFEHIDAPDNDGIYITDTLTSETKLIISTFQIANQLLGRETTNQKQWLNHCQWNREGTRFGFLSRGVNENDHTRKDKISTNFLTSDSDGRNIWVAPNIIGSHYDYGYDGNIVLTHGKGHMYWFIEDQRHVKPIPQMAHNKRDGHVSYSPNGEFFLSDTYPDKNMVKTLFLVDVKTGKQTEIDSFIGEILKPDSIRNDSHPRWSPDGLLVHFDGTQNNIGRQTYISYVGDLTRKKQSDFNDIPNPLTATIENLYWDPSTDKTLHNPNTDSSKVFCNADTSRPEYDIVFGILSTAKNKMGRMAIRKTYLGDASINSVAYCKVMHKFFVSSQAPEYNATDIKLENDMYDDIVVTDSPYDSEKLIYATEDIFMWVNRFIPEYQYLVKTDDDSYWNLVEFVKVLKHSDREKLYMGYIHKAGHVYTEPDHPYSNIPYYNDMKKTSYFPYASGAGYILSKDVVQYLSQSFVDKKHWPREDASVGTWLATANIKPTHLANAVIRRDKCYVKRNKWVLLHKLDPREFTVVYKMLKHKFNVCKYIQNYTKYEDISDKPIPVLD